ncbi:MAG: MBL fold metallo-hydrolase [Anaerolineales bacterium]
MFEIAFLGTSAAAPTIYRGLSSQMIIANEHRFLLDCGEGTQRQILQSGLGFKRLEKVLLTHAHLDHILGLGGLISTLARWESLSQIDIWAGEATLTRVSNLLFDVVFIGQRPDLPLHLHPLSAGIFFEDKKFSVSAFPVHHQGPGNFGFVFQEHARRPFLAEKADALGVPFGPVRGRLVAGETITLEDGRTIHPDEVLGAEIPGAKLVHVGDCGNPSNLYDIATDADCLVMEATYLDEEADMAAQFGHMTAGGSARFAREVGAQALVLTHISRRSREYEIRDEARAIFPETIVARDFDHFVISKHKPLSRAQRAPEDA